MRRLTTTVVCLLMGMLLLLAGAGITPASGEQQSSSNPSRIASAQEDDAAVSSSPCLASSCTNVAGVWQGYMSGSLHCTVLGEDSSFYMESLDQSVTVTQSGCSIYYTLSGYPQYPGTGTVTGNSVNISGAMVDPGDVGYPYIIAQNHITGTGTLSGNTAYGNVSGSVGGSVLVDGEWVNLSCSAYAYFSITRMTPVQATLISPSGTIATNQPTYQWHAVSNATWYQLWVNDTSGTVVKEWYPASAAGCGSGSGSGTCSITPDVQVGEDAQWWIRTYNSYGNGAWSEGLEFSAPSLVPHQVALISPSGAIAVSAPTYTWYADPKATWYLLRVVDSKGERIKKWYTAAQAGCAEGIDTCSVTPEVFVRQGAAIWEIRTWSKYGYGPWSASMAFTAPTPAKPGAATPVSPSGTIDTSLPTYVWEPVANATWYLLEVQHSGGKTVRKWYTAAAAGCAEGAENCSVTPDTLVSGASQWWIQTWNPVGNGPWSGGMSFTAPKPAKPGAATLLSPAGTITTSKPAYTWEPVPDATWYYLWVKDSKGNVIDKWYAASEANCAGGLGTCSVTPDASLAQGAAKWWLQPWNPLGTGPWSNRSFTVNAVSSSGKP